MGKAKRAHHRLSDGHGHNPLPILLPSIQTDVICLSKYHSPLAPLEQAILYAKLCQTHMFLFRNWEVDDRVYI